MLSIWRDLHFAIRSLGRSRSLAAVGIVSIALGIGVNITAFSVIRELVFDDVTAQHPERLAPFTDGNREYRPDSAAAQQNGY